MVFSRHPSQRLHLFPNCHYKYWFWLSQFFQKLWRLYKGISDVKQELIISSTKHQTTGCFPGHLTFSLWFYNKIKESTYYLQTILARCNSIQLFFHSEFLLHLNTILFKTTRQLSGYFSLPWKACFQHTQRQVLTILVISQSKLDFISFNKHTESTADTKRSFLLGCTYQEEKFFSFL